MRLGGQWLKLWKLTMSKLPRVVFVGRPNVGKSTLFNRLADNIKSIVYDYEGVTRDFVTDTVCWQDTCMELVDSGGISMKTFNDPLQERVRQVGLSLIESADLVLFVCDAQVGITTDDQAVAKFLRKLSVPVLLVLNKADTAAAEQEQYTFSQLGFDTILPVSALHGTGIAELLQAMVDNARIRVERVQEEPAYRVALLGKPNVGKSSLMNELLKKERTLVSDIPGTTREAVSENVNFFKETLQLTDTPGIRRRRSIDEPLEELMVKTAFRAVKHSDIILLMIDGTEGDISNQELKLAFYAFEQQHKALIVLINKEDIVEDVNRIDLEHEMEYYQHFLKKIPRLNISCKTGHNINKILPLIKQVWERYNQTFDGQQLSVTLKEALVRRPLYHKTERLRLYSVKQVGSAPITIVLTVNQPDWFGESQLKYFENVMRQNYDLVGVPIRFVVKKR